MQLPPDRQPLLQLQHPAGAAGGGGLGVGLGAGGLGQDGEEGLPLGGQGCGAAGGEGGLDQGLEPGAQGGGEAVQLAGAQTLGRGEVVLQRLGHLHIGAQAVQLLAAGGGMQGGGGGIGGGKQPLIDGAEEGEALLPRRGVGADLVFGDHGGHGVGDRGGGAQEGGNLGMAEGGAGMQAPVAGDEAVPLRLTGRAEAGGGERPDLDRHAQAGGGDGAGQFGKVGGVEGAAVARQGIGVDLGQGEGVHGAAPLRARVTRRGGVLPLRRAGRAGYTGGVKACRARAGFDGF